jgi:hypothetical protein
MSRAAYIVYSLVILRISTFLNLGLSGGSGTSSRGWSSGGGSGWSSGGLHK